MSPLAPGKVHSGRRCQCMTIIEICALSALVVDVIRLIIDILKYRSDKKD